MDYWLVLFGAVVTLVCFILHQRGGFRFVYLTTKIPGPSLWTLLRDYAKDFFLMGEILDLVSKITLRSEYKPWGLWLGPTDFMLIVSDVDTVSEVLTNKNFSDKCVLVYKMIDHYLGGGSLITLNGETFKRHRKAVAPAFKKRYVEQHLTRINSEAMALVEELRTIATGDSVDVRHFVHMSSVYVSLEIFTSGTYMNSSELIQRYTSTVYEGLDLIQLRSFHPLYYWFWFKHKSSTKQMEQRLEETRAEAKNIFLEELHAREREDAAKRDQKPSNMAEFVVRGTSQGEGFHNEDEAFNETMFLLFAGAETSSFTINVCLQMLALHQDVQERAFREVDSLLGNRNEIEPDDIANMLYLEMVIKETLRIFPVAPILGRMASEETNLNGLTVPKGTTVAINLLALHRNPHVYEEPLKFDPDRFTPEALERRSPLSWVGFSYGYRICPGQLQGMYIVKTIVGHILKNFRLLPGVGLESIHDLKFKMSFDWHLLNSSLRLIPRQCAT